MHENQNTRNRPTPDSTVGHLASQYTPRTLLHLALFYGFFLVAWPAVGDAYRGVFRANCRLALWPVETRGSFQVSPLQPRQQLLDTEIVAQGKYSRRAGHILLESKTIGYMPGVLFLALMFSTPIPWRRRATCSLFGIVALTTFISFRTVIPVLRIGSQQDLGIFTMNHFWQGTIANIDNLFASRSEVGFVVAVLTWLLIALWEGWLPTEGGKK